MEHAGQQNNALRFVYFSYRIFPDRLILPLLTALASDGIGQEQRDTLALKAIRKQFCLHPFVKRYFTTTQLSEREKYRDVETRILQLAMS